jgi:hypothetical protein
VEPDQDRSQRHQADASRYRPLEGVLMIMSTFGVMVVIAIVVAMRVVRIRLGHGRCRSRLRLVAECGGIGSGFV